MKLRNIATIYLLNNDKILLMYRIGSRLFKENLWVGIGGHFENDELNNPKACVLRELFEETGLTDGSIRNLVMKYMTTRKTSDEIRQQYIYFADLNDHANLINSEEGILAWKNINQINSLKMSFTNEQCLNHYFHGGKDNEEIYSASLTVIDNKPHMNFTCLTEFTFSY